MNRGYISTLCPSELILVIKMTSSDVPPAHAVLVMSASTRTHRRALSQPPAASPRPGLQPPGRPPHFSLSRACSASPSAMPWPERRVKVSSGFRAVPCPSAALVLRPHSPGHARRWGGCTGGPGAQVARDAAVGGVFTSC